MCWRRVAILDANGQGREGTGYRLRTSDYRKKPSGCSSRSPKPEARSLTEASPVKIDGLSDRLRFLMRVSRQSALFDRREEAESHDTVASGPIVLPVTAVGDGGTG